MPRKPSRKDSEDQPAQHFSRTADTRANMPRPHHYLFAHRVVPAMFFADPLKFLDTLENNGEGLLNFLWGKIGQDMKEEDRLEPEGLGFELRQLGNGVRVGVIRLPKPKGLSEAYLTAAVYQAAEGAQEERRRYFTLERGMTLRGKLGTVLGEWEGVKNHLNFGDGPDPQVGSFVEAIERKMGKRLGGVSSD